MLSDQFQVLFDTINDKRCDIQIQQGSPNASVKPIKAVGSTQWRGTFLIPEVRQPSSFPLDIIFAMGIRSSLLPSMIPKGDDNRRSPRIAGVDVGAARYRRKIALASRRCPRVILIRPDHRADVDYFEALSRIVNGLVNGHGSRQQPGPRQESRTSRSLGRMRLSRTLEPVSFWQDRQ